MNSKATIYSFLGVGMAVTLALIVAPVVYAVSLSFYRLDSFVGTPQWVGLGNYIAVLSLPEFWSALTNGLIYSFGSIVLQLVLGIGFALVLNEVFPGRNFVRGLSILPYLLPTVVVVLTFKWMVDGSIGIITAGIAALGLPPVNWFESPGAAMTSVIFVSVWMWTPFVTTCFLAALQTVPASLYEAARVDGTTAVQRFFHITLPMLKPILTVVVLLRAIWMFNKFDVIWLLTRGGPVGATEHLAILSYRHAFSLFDIGGGAAIATISFLILSVVVFIYFRLFPLETE
ncbi:carbohydrate ABC transporter permease [Phreatobacter sp. AB_2022a]|uniref:carbohydrate ABC transporter permease n=1 Tax=Phreatobacter sp. AB_2022a TaxID=3003134 RepID=UPI00056E9A28|nr:sugar ABC transporter permease [Phreatobacter sp. AB_2022a]MCZ0736639.1 sugar ABC transporter permease [Phreatobacter sp. AB_2022a]CEJ13737.1 Inner membrane ABC transporter permease protein YcjO [bacterium YEK0313]